MFDFDYDWRLSNFYNAEQLKAFIDRKVPNKDTKVDIVAHSMGGLIARLYVQSFGGDQRVNNLIMFGTPHQGSVKVFRRLKEGFDNWPSALSGGLAEIQKTILSFPSTYQLLPSYDACCAFSKTGTNQDAEYLSVFDKNLWSRLLWLPEEFKSSKGNQFIDTQLKEARRLFDLMKAPVFSDPANSDRAVYVANGFIKTWSRVYFHPENGAIMSYVENAGDGTVLMDSAVNGNMRNLRLSHKEHERIFDGKDPVLLLKAILSDTIWHKGDSDFTKILLDARGSSFLLHSIGYEVQPQVLTPDSTGVLTLSLEGDRRLADADLSNLEVTFDDASGASTRLISSFSSTVPFADRFRRTVKFSFVASHEEGVSRIRLNIVGAEELEQRVLVVGAL